VAREDKTVWPLDPHTKAKHVILRKYLNAWLPKLTRWNGRVVIYDGFAGPGIYSEGEEGSPVIALNAYLEHDFQSRMKADIKYLFVEDTAGRCECLQQVIGKIEVPQSVDIDIVNEECEVALTQLLDYLDEKQSQLAPTFAFIDPFGVSGIPLDMIARLMKHPKCEVLITCMLGYIQRFVGTPEFEDHMDQLFGCAEWRVALEMSGEAREEFLRALYQRQLETVVGAKYVRHFTMKDDRNKTIYDLFFATNSASGIDAMKDAMWKVDESGGDSFSDATDPRQATLFTAKPDWDQLFDLLCQRFKGTDQRWVDVVEAIRQTPFRIMKRPFQTEAKSKEPRFTIINRAGVRKGTLQDDTVVRFH